jgi:hypothetical protein
MNKFIRNIALAGALITTPVMAQDHKNCPIPDQQKIEQEKFNSKLKETDEFIETYQFVAKNRYISIQNRYYYTNECVAFAIAFKQLIEEELEREAGRSISKEVDKKKYPEYYMTSACNSELVKGRITYKKDNIYMSYADVTGTVYWKNFELNKDELDLQDIVKWWLGKVFAISV